MLFVISGESIIHVHSDEVRLHYMHQKTEGSTLYMQTNLTWFQLATYDTHAIGLREYKELLDLIMCSGINPTPTVVIGSGCKPTLEVAIFNNIVDAKMMRAYPNGRMTQVQIGPMPAEVPPTQTPVAEKEPALD